MQVINVEANHNAQDTDEELWNMIYDSRASNGSRSKGERSAAIACFRTG